MYLINKKNIRFIQNRIIPENLIIKYQFKKYVGYLPNLKSPVTFTEKMQWLKLNDRSSLHTQCADKYLARDFVSSTIGKNYLVPLQYQTYDVKNLTPDKIPKFPCIIKTNHDCGGMIIVWDKSKMDWESIRQKLQNKLKKNYYYFGREWQYKKIKPCIIVETLLLNKNGELPLDYKVLCFNGKVKIIAVDKDKGKKSNSRHFFDENWNKEDIICGLGADKSIIEKPLFLDKMIRLSEKLSKNFIFVRVDWYDIDGKLYMGELTFHPGSGYLKFCPEKWDKIFGDFIDLKN